MKIPKIKSGMQYLLILCSFIILSCSSSPEMQQANQYSWINYDTVKAGNYDTGKMWTFEYAPKDYFAKTYNFRPTDEWLDNVRMSALKFATWCSASFVSEDGLIMSNHHCIDFVSNSIEKEGEDIRKNGFYAETLSDERKVPGVFVDQLVLIVDVTDDILTAMKGAASDAERLQLRDEKINELTGAYTEDTGLVVRIISLYNGGRYSLYGYKRYDDVRAVFFAESEIGLYGGDPDNFTYPRYNLDCSFLRVYDSDGKPLKTDHFFKWSPQGAQNGEPLFVVGNPASTNRLKTVAQLEYFRDVSYRNNVFIINGLKNTLLEIIAEYPERQQEFENQLFLIENSSKALTGQLEGLRDPYLMARKKDFEKKFRNAVMSDNKLSEKYGGLWDAIANVKNEMRNYSPKLAVYNLNPQVSSGYFLIAKDLVELAKHLQLPEEQRDEYYKGENLKEVINTIFPESFDEVMEYKKLKLQADFIRMNLGNDNELVKNMFASKTGKEAADYILKNSIITDNQSVLKLANAGADAILKSNDPFIYYILNTQDEIPNLSQKMQELLGTERALQDLLGQALYAVYGSSIPPDATFTLRIGDGVMKSYNYNGTEAPVRTTFYGMYDRYFSHQKEFPWDLPSNWVEALKNMNLETTINFVTTHDIIGGSSGSPVINQKGEIVGIAFDGNIESLPGDFIYTTKANRMVSVATQGIVEALNVVYKAQRITDELKSGKIPEKYLATENAN